MVSTVALSLFYAFFFFMALIYTIGPEGNSGDIGYCLKKIKEKYYNSDKKVKNKAIEQEMSSVSNI